MRGWFRFLLGCCVLTGSGFLNGCSDRTNNDRGLARQQARDDSRSLPEAVEPLPTLARFIDETERAGINFTYRNGEDAGHATMLETLGGGVAFIDVDADGWFDLFFPGGGEFRGREIAGLPPVMYRKRGDGRFVDVTREAGLDHAPFYSHGAAAGDFNEDGFPDLLVTGWGGLLLYRNQGDGTFVEIAFEARLSGDSWSNSAAWGDVNGDGHLDLYIAHYLDWSFDNHPRCTDATGRRRDVCNPMDFAPLPDLFYISNGDGTFRDATREFGMREDGKGLGVVTADLDLDGDLDIYVANDTTANFLYRNDGDGRLTEVGLISGTGLDDGGAPDGSMGTDAGDFDRDGLPDLWVVNFEHEAFALYRNLEDCNFLHASQATRITTEAGLYVGWGTAFLDFDRGGDLDLFVSNGHPNRFPELSPRRQRPLLFENREGKRFENVASRAGPYMASAHNGRGAAVGDWDNDGRLDLVISHVNEPVVLLRNEAPDDNHWISFHLIGTRSPRTAIGASVFIRTDGGRQLGLVKGGGSYLSSQDPRVFFGLGKHDRIGRVEIRWPSGTVQELTNVAADQILHVIEPR